MSMNSKKMFTTKLIDIIKKCLLHVKDYYSRYSSKNIYKKKMQTVATI